MRATGETLLLFDVIQEMILAEILELVICIHHACKCELRSKSIEMADVHLKIIKALVREMESLDLLEIEAITDIDMKILTISEELEELSQYTTALDRLDSPFQNGRATL